MKKQKTTKQPPQISKMGRPPKFSEERRPVTLTLPLRTLQQLENINQDRAKAIVKAVDLAAPATQPHDAVQLVEMSPGQALIVINQCNALRKISWLRLVEIAPSRFLLSIPSGTPIESLEVAILDLISELPPQENTEKILLEALRAKLSSVRRGHRLTKAEILFVSA